jgi:hypothetical protein
MKKIIALLFVIALSMLTLFLGDKKNKQNKVTSVPEGTRDEDMAGPRGEEIFVGPGGGRYFIKDGKRIYVGYRGKKPPAS